MKVYEKPELTLYGSLDVGAPSDASPSNSAAVCLCDCAQGNCSNVGLVCTTDTGTCASGAGCTCDEIECV